MGLDVYLYKYENHAETERLEEEYENKSNEIWKTIPVYDSATDEEKNTVRQKCKDFALSLGLNEHGEHPGKSQIKIDSEIDKEHYFKIGYFRSSYNGGGINRVLSNLGLSTLDDIFNPGNEYCFRPNWQDALDKTNSTIHALESTPGLRCFEVSPNIFGQRDWCLSEQEALEIYQKELNEKRSFTEFSNSRGEFFLGEALKVRALIIGKKNLMGVDSPSTYVITESDNTWYVNALKIVRETIEYVLSQPDKDKYYLRWSG